MTGCAVPRCAKPKWKNGLCTTHYNRSPSPYMDSYDVRAVAYYTGAADARHGRPRRVDLADTSLVGRLYTRGYDHHQRQP